MLKIMIFDTNTLEFKTDIGKLFPQVGLNIFDKQLPIVVGAKLCFHFTQNSRFMCINVSIQSNKH